MHDQCASCPIPVCNFYAVYGLHVFQLLLVNSLYCGLCNTIYTCMLISMVVTCLLQACNGLWKSFWVKSFGNNHETWLESLIKVVTCMVVCPANMVVILTWANTASRLQLILYSLLSITPFDNVLLGIVEQQPKLQL